MWHQRILLVFFVVVCWLAASTLAGPKTQPPPKTPAPQPPTSPTTSPPTQPPTQPSTSPATTVVSTTATNGRDYTLKCWSCNSADLLTCNVLKQLINCPNVTDVCYVKAEYVSGLLIISKGCRARDECSSSQLQNSASCSSGTVTDSNPCNWCCESDSCNNQENPTSTTPVSTTEIAATTTPPQPTTTPVATTTSIATTTPLVPSTSGGSSRNFTLKCWQCDREKKDTCDILRTVLDCPDVTNVCFVKAENIAGVLFLTKGCQPRDECLSKQQQNNAVCSVGAVNTNNSCNWCCDSDRCNDQVQPTSTVPVVPTAVSTTLTSPPTTSVPCTAAPTTPAPPQCDLVAYKQCDDAMQHLVYTAFVTPDQLVNIFCSFLPKLSECITVIQGCIGCGTEVRFNSSLIEALVNMSSLCSSKCDVTAAMLCLNRYYQQVSVAVISGNVDCVHLSRVRIQQQACYALAISNCDMSIRLNLESFFLSIERQVINVCFLPPSVQPPVKGSTAIIQTPGQSSTVTTQPPTSPPDTPTCNRTLAIECITSFNYEVMKYQSNNGNNIVAVCSKLEWSKNCYIQASRDCPQQTCDQLTASWNASASIVSAQCIAIVKPKCDTTAARTCILQLWNLVDGAKDFETACSLLNATVVCVEYEMAGCSLDEQVSMNNSLQIVINLIGNRCENVVEISPGCNSSINICEGDNNGLIFYRFNQPPSTLCGSTANCQIFIDINVDITGVNSPRCRNGQIITQSVLQVSEAFKSTMTSPNDAFSREVTEANWNQNQTISMAARIDLIYDGEQTRQVTITYRKTISGQTVESRTIGSFILRICDRDRPSICSIVNDPHITTFDRWYYNNFQEGFFVAYKHQTLPYEVQVATQKCNGHASCNCAVGVRSGDTVFFLDSCRRKSFVQKYCKGKDKYQCVNLMKISLFAHTQITPGTRIFSRNNGKEFVIWFPHGTMVKITYSGNYMNIWITPSAGDWNRTEGLCGLWDGVAENDLMLRNGSTYRGQGAWPLRGQQPIAFDNNWRVPDAEIISAGVLANPFLPPYHCVQEKIGTAVVSRCGYDAILEICDLDTSGKEILITTTLKAAAPVHSDGRRVRRDATNDLNDLDMDITAVPQTVNDNSSWNRTAALAYCQKYFQSFPATSSCMNNGVTSTDNSLDACADDLVVTGNTTWMDTAMEALKEQCLQEIQRNVTLQSSPIAANILANSCPNQCSQNGMCVNGTCVCNSPYTGQDCSLNSSAPVGIVIPFNNGLCDVNSSNCYVAQMMGVGFVPNVTTCIVQPAVVTDTVTVTGQPTNVGPAIYISPTEAHCPLSTLSSAYVVLTNTPANSSVNSNSSLIIIYNSICFTCLASDGVSQPTCTQLSTACVINGVCYGSGQQNPQNLCQICNPMNSTSLFSTSSSSSCVVATPAPIVNTDGSPVGLIIGLTVGLSALIAVVIGLVTWLCIKRQLEKSWNLRRASAQQRSFNDDLMVAPPTYEDNSTYKSDALDEETRTHSTI